MERRGASLCFISQGALSSSFRLDVGCLDHLGPFHEFDLDVLDEFFRGARDRFEAKHSKPLPDVGQRHDLDDLAMKESYDLFWRSGRYDETLPVVARDIRIADLRQGRYRRVDGDYQSGENRERNQIEVLAELIRGLAV